MDEVGENNFSGTAYYISMSISHLKMTVQVFSVELFVPAFLNPAKIVNVGVDDSMDT